MRRFLHRHKWFTVFAVALLLVATSVSSMSRMTCLEAGHSVLSFGKGEDCCPPLENDHELPTVSANCCAFSEVISDGADQRIERPLDLVVALEALDNAPLLQVTLPLLVETSVQDTLPPPDDAVARLALLRRLLI